MSVSMQIFANHYVFILSYNSLKIYVKKHSHVGVYAFGGSHITRLHIGHGASPSILL